MLNSSVKLLPFQGVPDPMRGQIWQMLADVDHDPEILNNYSILVTKVRIFLTFNDLLVYYFHVISKAI